MHATRLAPSRHAGLPGTALLCATLATGCATFAPQDAGEPEIPADAVPTSRVEDNGDVITEYRVGGLLRMIRVQPERGPVYYLIDDNGDGRVDRNTGGQRGPLTYYKLFGF